MLAFKFAVPLFPIDLQHLKCPPSKTKQKKSKKGPVGVLILWMSISMQNFRKLNDLVREIWDGQKYRHFTKSAFI